MRFRKVVVLRGPNIWANSPVIEAWVELGPLKDTASNAVLGFNDRLKSWLPSMIEHECSEGHRGGFFVRLDEGTYPAHILEHVTLELQSLAGTPVGYGRARVTSEEGVYRVVFKYQEEAVGLACLETARALILAALEDRPFDVTAEVRRLGDLVQQERPDPSTGALIAAARLRNIPCRRLGSGCFIQLGHGALQRRISATETDRTGAIASSIARDKELTRQLLGAVGVPVPEGRPVIGADDAWAAAEELGPPVVIKPRGSEHVGNVGLGLRTREEVVAAYEAAAVGEDGVLVEREVPGEGFRLLVVGDRVVAASRRDSSHVLGSGPPRVAESVAGTNGDHRHGDDPATPLRKVHLEVAARAVEAVRVVGLEVAGVDVITVDIGRPLEETGGVVLGVDPSPDLRMHLERADGPTRPVAEAILATLFPPGEDGRIPIVAVTGVNGKTTTTRLVAHIVRGTGMTVGMTCTDGIYIGIRRIEVGDCSGPRSARAILLNPKVEAAVLECARGGILREGLGFDRCKVAVVMNIGEGDHLGLAELHTAEDLIKVKRVPVDVVSPDGYAVLKADDPLVAGMAEYCKGRVIYFARDPSDPVVSAHRGAGGRAAFVRDGAMVLAEGPREEVVARLVDVPLTLGGRVAFQVENALAAAAACWGLGLPHETIRAGLASFDSDPDRTPGRFNVLTADGATIILDFGHNPSAMQRLVESLPAFPGDRRTLVLSAAGDRSDSVIVRQGRILADAFDEVILYDEPSLLRGRAEGEINDLLRLGLADGSRVSEVREVHGELAAIERALDDVRPGDLLLILLDDVEVSLPFVRDRLARKAAAEGARPAVTSTI